MIETMTDYSWLDADLRDFIRKTEAAYPTDAARHDAAQQRVFYDTMCRLFDYPHPPDLRTEDRSVAGVPCRVYTPAEAAVGVTVIYYHGGGFVVGGLHSHDSICADLAAMAKVTLIAVDYRLSPEHKHPAAFDDAMAVAGAVAGPRVLAGDSAGGTLAAAVSAHLPGIGGQVLIYPGLGGSPELPSYTRHAQAPLLTRDECEYYVDAHFAGGRDEALGDPSAAPLRATTFAHIPPTAIFAAECDPLASDADEYAARLRAAGVPVTLMVEPGLVHGYLRARHMAAGARASFARIAETLSALAIRAGAVQ